MGDLLKSVKKAIAENDSEAYNAACESCMAFAQKLKVENEKNKIPETLRRTWAKENNEKRLMELKS